VRFGWVNELEQAGWAVIAPDLPGHGSAPKHQEPHAYADLENDVFSLVEKSQNVVGVGFSLGARVVLGIEVDHPGTFQRIVIAGVGANLLSDYSTDAMAEAIESGHGELGGDPLARAILSAIRGPNNDALALAAFLKRPRRNRFAPSDFAAIRCPVLVVVGDNDPRAHPTEPLFEVLEKGSLLVVPGADHFGTMRSPDFLYTALDFIGSGREPSQRD
jgi:pimeloyl-ACP methyl ester carboxylesterase